MKADKHDCLHIFGQAYLVALGIFKWKLLTYYCNFLKTMHLRSFSDPII